MFVGECDERRERRTGGNFFSICIDDLKQLLEEEDRPVGRQLLAPCSSVDLFGKRPIRISDCFLLHLLRMNNTAKQDGHDDNEQQEEEQQQQEEDEDGAIHLLSHPQDK